MKTREEKIKNIKILTRDTILESKKSFDEDWDTLCQKLIMPEYFIEEFIEFLPWKLICTHQCLSEDLSVKLTGRLLQKYKECQKSL